MWLFSCLTLSRGTSECHSPNVHSKLNCQSGEVDPSGNYSPKAKNNRPPRLRRVGSSQSRRRRQGDPLQYPLKYWKGDTLGPPCDSVHCFFKIPVMCSHVQFPPSKVPEDNSHNERSIIWSLAFTVPRGSYVTDNAMWTFWKNYCRCPYCRTVS